MSGTVPQFSRQKGREGHTDTEWWVCTQGSCAGLQGPAGPREALLMRTSLMLKEMNLCLCDGAQTHKAKGTLHLLSPFQKENTRDGIILFDSYHNIYSPYGQPASWHRAKATCPPKKKKKPETTTTTKNPMIFCLTSSSLKVGQPTLWT